MFLLMNLIITKWLLVYVLEHKHNFYVIHFLSLTVQPRIIVEHSNVIRCSFLFKVINGSYGSLERRAHFQGLFLAERFKWGRVDFLGEVLACKLADESTGALLMSCNCWNNQASRLLRLQEIVSKCRHTLCYSSR